MNTIEPKEDNNTNHGFEYTKRSNPIVYGILQKGGTLEDCIIALDKFNVGLQFRILELEAIAPRKLVTPDGRIMVWHCPDHLVPLTKI